MENSTLFALLLVAALQAGVSSADPDRSQSKSVTTDQIAPASQIPVGSSDANDETSARRRAVAVNLQQIVSPAATPLAARQISSPDQQIGSQSLSTVREGRNLDAAAVGGRDHCDTESASSRNGDCASIPDYHPQDYARPATEAPTLEQILVASPAASDEARNGAGPAPALPAAVTNIVAGSGAPGGGVTVVTVPPH